MRESVDPAKKLLRNLRGRGRGRQAHVGASALAGEENAVEMRGGNDGDTVFLMMALVLADHLLRHRAQIQDWHGLA